MSEFGEGLDNFEGLENLTESITKVTGLFEAEDLDVTEAMDTISEFSDVLPEFKDQNPELDENIDKFIDSVKELSEKVENGEDFSFKDIMDIIGPLLKIWLPLLKAAILI